MATTFISHTVGAMVILPIVQSVGEAMAGTPHPKLLVMAAALMCSGGEGRGRGGEGRKGAAQQAVRLSHGPRSTARSHLATRPRNTATHATPCPPGAMGLPVSGFPNMNAVSIEDSTGNPIVGTPDFLLVGVPSSLAAYGVIVTLGYALMLLVGF